MFEPVLPEYGQVAFVFPVSAASKRLGEAMDPARIVADHLIWESIRAECAEAAANEPLLAGFLSHVVLSQPDLETALAYILAAKLDNATLPALSLRDIILDVLRDEECIQAYRVAHSYWERDRQALALYLQSRISEVFAVDIHPAAKIGKGIMFDHATSVVIGETAVVEDDFSMLHEVTLGGSGKVGGDRHPKIGRGVMIGAGAKVLGNIRVGEGAKIGAGSVVLKDVPPRTTVAGIPARVVSVPSAALPALDMDQFLPSAQ